MYWYSTYDRLDALAVLTKGSICTKEGLLTTLSTLSFSPDMERPSVFQAEDGGVLYRFGSSKMSKSYGLSISLKDRPLSLVSFCEYSQDARGESYIFDELDSLYNKLLFGMEKEIA